MNHPKKILATLTVALTLAVVPTAFADDDPRLPPPQCPFLGGCTDAPVPPAPEPEPECGLGQLCLGVLPAAPIPVQPEPIVTTVPPCQEDQPCWDCTTMGNKICGPVLGVLPVTL